VALAVIPSGRTINFNASREDIRAAVRKIVGRSVRSHGYYTIELSELFTFEPGASPDDRIVQQRVVERECPRGRGAYSCELELRIEADFRLQEVTDHTQSSVRFLLALLQELAVVSGPKTLVLISEGLPMKSDSGESRTVSLLSAQSAASRVTIYSVLFDVDQVDVAASRSSGFVGHDQGLSETPLRDLASLSGGTAYRVVGRAEDAFGRLVRELSAKYVLTFPVLPEDRDGKPHQIRLMTTKRNLTVHSRAQFVATGEEADLNRLLQSALRSQFANSLAVKVGTYAIRDSDASKIRLLVSVDLPDLPAPVSQVNLAYQLVNRGKSVGGDARTVSIERDGSGFTLPISWIAFQHLSPGDYELHLSAAVGPEQVGSVTRSVQAHLHEFDRVRVSDLLLASEAPDGAGPFPVPADLAFGGGQIVAGIEIYERSSREGDRAQIEIEILPAENLGEPLISRTAVLAPSGTPVRRFARPTLSISTLTPGEYVVRAVVKMNGRAVGSVSRHFTRLQSQAPM
jgi:hypothetical protein